MVADRLPARPPWNVEERLRSGAWPSDTAAERSPSRSPSNVALVGSGCRMFTAPDSVPCKPPSKFASIIRLALATTVVVTSFTSYRLPPTDIQTRPPDDAMPSTKVNAESVI